MVIWCVITLYLQIIYRTDIYGTFRQSVIFDFGGEPVLVRQLCVDSNPVVDIDKLSQSLILSECGRWDLATKNIEAFTPKWVLLIDNWVDSGDGGDSFSDSYCNIQYTCDLPVSWVISFLYRAHFIQKIIHCATISVACIMIVNSS